MAQYQSFREISRLSTPIKTQPSLFEQPNPTGVYSYGALEDQNDIRLIILHPGPFYSSIKCDLITVDLASPPEYEALSYTWADHSGDTSHVGTVLCGPSRDRIAITRNCETVLRKIRLGHDQRLLWIDSICIDQTELRERSHQVSLMSKIYHSASRVIVYLGEATTESDIVFDSINSTDEKWLSRFSREQACILHISLFCRPWFTRLWVLQEIALARAAIVVCGDRKTRWQRLSKFYNNDVQRCHPAGPHAAALFKYGLKGVNSIECLPEIFFDACKGRASDPRDTVFALLGMVERDARVDIVPNYETSTKRLFTKTVIYFLDRAHVLFPPSFFVHDESRHSHVITTWRPPAGRQTKPLDDYNSKLPSWCFDWSQGGRPGSPIHFAEKSFSFDSAIEPRALVIKGQRVLSGCILDQDQNIRLGSDPELDPERSKQIFTVAEKVFLYYKIKRRQSAFSSEEKEEWVRKEMRNIILVRVSELSSCAILRPILDGCYILLGGASGLRQCKPGDKCFEECYLPILQLEDERDFTIL